MKKSLLFSLAILVASPLFAVPRAVRSAQVDSEGVLRWTDNGQEVALLGVNYYPPFTVDYDALTNRNISISQTLRDDVAHFRRLGLTCMRIHCFDRQFSTQDGDFIANDHVKYLDELIDLCARNGIYMVLTPIAWWGGHYASGVPGFSARFSMHEMTSNREAWAVQAKFLKAFGEHVNTVTGFRYADEPSVLAFECINEPLYPKSHPDREVTAYIDTLVDGLRASGTTKPIFYNSWQKRNAAAGASKADGITGSYYPTGLVAGHALRGSQLGRVRASTLAPDESVAKKAKMIYEFDAADTPGSYMYPALGKLFRHEGVQVAAMFQYDPMPLAPYNRGWKTHFLNLVYTPRKALSIAIMAEVFRHVPRGIDYAAEETEQIFQPFRANAARDLSEYVGSDTYIYTNDPLTPPVNAAALRHVWGCGTSTVAGSSGNGAYFLDRMAEGVWRLQLYPSTFQLADPYTGRANKKAVILPDAAQLTLQLPDLGPAWSATPKDGTAPLATATNGVATLPPGDYTLTRQASTPSTLATAAQADLPPYVAPPAEPPQPRLAVQLPAQSAAGVDLPFELASSRTRQITAELVREDDGRTEMVSVTKAPFIPGTILTPGDWSVRFQAIGTDGTRTSLPTRESDNVTWLRAAHAPAHSLLPTADAYAQLFQDGLSSKVSRPDRQIVLETGLATKSNVCAGVQYALKPLPATTRETALVLEIENRGTTEARLELGFCLDAGGGFGCNLTLVRGLNRIQVNPEDIHPLWGGPTTARPWERVVRLSLLTGTWLWHGPVPRQHLVIRKIERQEVEPGYRLHVCRTADDWEIFDVPAALQQHIWGNAVYKSRALDDRGQIAYRLKSPTFAGEHECASVRLNTDATTRARQFPTRGPGRALLVRARALYPRTDRLEFALVMNDGKAWGTVIPLTSEWKLHRIPLDALTYFKQWGLPEKTPDDKPDTRQMQAVNLCFGKWLFPKTFAEPHGIEISSIRIEDEETK